MIYVGNNGAYCGYLVYDGTTNKFSGSIDDSNLSDADYLHFYFMGNKGPVGSAPSTVSITNQTSKYPVISYAHSKTLYNSEVSTYTAKLQNYCAIVKFTTNNIPVETDITVKGMQNTVSVNFGANNAAAATPTLGVNPYTPGNSGTGDIILHAESPTERWAILLPGSGTTVTATATGYETATGIEIPAIGNNDFVSNGITLTLTAAAPAADYVFSVSSTQTVHFSPGNLRYKYDEGWRFTEHQYDYIDYFDNWDPEDWVDLFGWGTWGSGMNPLNQSTGVNDYPWSSDFQGTLDGHNDWRTLTKDEWQYILDHSTHGMARVNSVYGIVILPDNSTLSISNEYTASNWTNDMEAYGAVFLPAAGSRYGTRVTGVGSDFNYWSSTPQLNGNPSGAMHVYNDEDEDEVDQVFIDRNGRSQGCSVRLVRDL